MALTVGMQAPDFTLPSTTGKRFTLSQHMKGKACILYFYPKDFTPGCTKEACGFRDAFSFFRNMDIDILGISADTVLSHQKFKEKYELPFELLADVNRKVAKSYQATLPLIGTVRRITYLLAKDHKIAAVYKNLFGAEKHVQEMVETIKTSDT